MQDSFMLVEDHFIQLVERLDKSTQDTYHACKHKRIETAFAGRNFVIYEMIDRLPVILDRISINDFRCDSAEGASMEVFSSFTKQRMIVDHSPTQLFGYPVLMALPLHNKLRWSSAKSDIKNGSLAFRVLINTESRNGLRESGVIYCETGPSYGTEFESSHSIN